MDLSQSLAEIIIKHFQAEFGTIHLSRNLIDTIRVYPIKGGYEVKIPAQIYDIGLYRRTGAILYVGNASYASQVDKDGGFSGTHRGYINRCINNAIQEWKAINHIKAEIS